MVTTKRFGFVATVVALLVAAAIATNALDLVDGDAAVAVDDLSQLGVGLLATVSCWWTARRRTGPDRTWRLLMAGGMAGWSAGQVLWTWFQLIERTAVPSPSAADACYLSLVPFAFAALLVIGSHRRGETSDELLERRPRSARLVLLLDGLIVVGSLFVLTWSTSLGPLVQAEAPSTFGFVVAISYPLTDLVLLVIVVLLMADRTIVLQAQLRLLGLGLTGLAASDAVFAYLVGVGAPEVPPMANAGFIAGPAAIALAALYPRSDHERAATSTRAWGWTYLLMPYVPLLFSSILVVRKTMVGTVGQVDLIGICCGFGVFAAVILRQLVTIIDNTRLLGLLRESEQTLHHQAHHDTLTGLANRALFQERLEEAIDANRRGHVPFGLLFVDLDDFKAVNDVSGHASGDALLALVARRLKGCVRGEDLVARLGGDEFGVLVGGIEEPLRVADRIPASLGSDAVLNGVTYAVGASVGVVVCRDADPTTTAQSLLRHADNAMYEAKRDGKRGLVIHSPV